MFGPTRPQEELPRSVLLLFGLAWPQSFSMTIISMSTTASNMVLGFLRAVSRSVLVWSSHMESHLQRGRCKPSQEDRTELVSTGRSRFPNSETVVNITSGFVIPI